MASKPITVNVAVQLTAEPNKMIPNKNKVKKTIQTETKMQIHTKNSIFKKEVAYCNN